MSERLTYEKSVEIIKSRKCKPNFNKEWFDENYKSTETDMPLICSCGDKFSLKMKSIGRGVSDVKMCKDCTGKTKGKNQKISYEELISVIKSNSCKPLFNKKWYIENYEGVSTLLKIRCKCGTEIEKNFYNFKKSPHCNDCWEYIRDNSSKLKPDEIIDVIKSMGCKPNITKKWLRENYIGVNMELSYICSCGNVFEKSFNNFKEVPCCKECSKEKILKSRKKKFDSFKVVKFFVSMSDCNIAFNEDWYEKNYKGCNTILPVVCKCGNHTKTNYSTLKYVYQAYGRSYRCDECKEK